MHCLNYLHCYYLYLYLLSIVDLVVVGIIMQLVYFSLDYIQRQLLLLHKQLNHLLWLIYYLM